jgi:hypothetical protein
VISEMCYRRQSHRQDPRYADLGATKHEPRYLIVSGVHYEVRESHLPSISALHDRIGVTRA